MSTYAPAAVATQPTVDIREGSYKVASTTLQFSTAERVELRGITDEVAGFVEQTGIRHGIVQISSLHTTNAIFLNEIEDALLSDMASLFEQAAPSRAYYKHNDSLHSTCQRKNADAHLRAMMIGHSVTIPVEDGRLKLGTWQRILLAEFDGPNSRKVHLQVMGI